MGTVESLLLPDNVRHLAVESQNIFASCWSKVSGTISKMFEMNVNCDIYMDYGNDYG
jgi:hypothetical protein